MLPSWTYKFNANFQTTWILALVILFLCAIPVSAQQSAANTPDHESLNKKVIDLYKQGRYKQAMPLAVKNLKAVENFFGTTHPRVVQALNNLAELNRKLGHYADAEHLYLRSVNIGVKSLGKNHPSVAILLSNLALLYEALGNYNRAEIFYHRALKIWQSAVGPKHPKVRRLRGLLATLHQKQDPNFSRQTQNPRPQNIKKADSQTNRDKKNIRRNPLPVVSKLP